MDQETVTKVSQMEQLKNHWQAIEYLFNEADKHKKDERWLEAALLKMADLLKDEQKILWFLEHIACPLFKDIPTKAKINKILKLKLEKIAQFASIQVQIQATKFLITWANDNNRVYLRQFLETRLIALYLQGRNFTDALALIGSLLKELKKLDDKISLIEVFLLESKCFHALRNLPKSRASLTSARTSANSVYCPPLLQAQLDLQSGILHAEENDFKTAFSYFYETMEGYAGQDDQQMALRGLKYMLLSKIMLGNADEVFSLMTGKMALKYQGRDIEAMKEVATAYKNRNLKEFEAVVSKYSSELQSDVIVNYHLQALYDQLLEQNLIRIIEPYSRVQLAHVASTVQLKLPFVEQKLSQMILDKKFFGILDQRDGTLHVFEEPIVDQTFESSIETIQSMGHVVESLYEKSIKFIIE